MNVKEEDEAKKNERETGYIGVSTYIFLSLNFDWTVRWCAFI